MCHAMMRILSVWDMNMNCSKNGPDGWVSLGRKTATEPRLVYNNVPKNALLWLHNLSAGKEEQVFYMQNGQQIFLNKW